MKRFLIPIGLGVFGLVAGAGAGLFLKPEAETAAEPPPEDVVPPEYAKLNNQFVVPLLQDGQVVSMVILSLSLEVSAGSASLVYEREPKLRDLFLQVMFDHANSGGFRGSFTDAANLLPLRQALFEAAATVLPDVVSDVLIGDIVRQDS